MIFLPGRVPEEWTPPPEDEEEAAANAETSKSNSEKRRRAGPSHTPGPWHITLHCWSLKPHPKPIKGAAT